MRTTAPVERVTVLLSREDDLVSIMDRLSWTDADRVLLVLPEEGDLLCDRLDLMRLRRHVDELNLDVGLVTADGRVRPIARELGFPVFTTLRAGERSGRRVWRRARRARFRAYQESARTLIDAHDRAEVNRRRKPRATWLHWVLRYVGIVAFFLTLAILVIGVAYLFPTATITIRPLTEPLRVSRQIVADPQLETASASGASVPARQLTVTGAWQTTVETTGRIEIPDAPARGTVVFANTLAEPVTVPAGTRVTTSGSQRIIFQTLRDVEVPGVVGATSEAEIVAIEPGPQGNVQQDQINRIEGSLALQLEARNLEATAGGGVREARSVTEADVERLRAQVLQFVQALAVGEMEAQLTEREFLARDSLRVVEIYQETYSHFVGEQTNRLTLEIRAEVVGTAVDETEANGLIYDELVQNVQPGFELVPDSLEFTAGEVLGVDNQGRVSFIMIGQGRTAAIMELEPYLEAITGQPPEVALAYLNEQLPLRDYPETRVWPPWFSRMPYVPLRIQVQVDTSG